MAQTISYEVRIALILIVVLGVPMAFRLEEIYLRQFPWFGVVLIPVGVI